MACYLPGGKGGRGRQDMTGSEELGLLSPNRHRKVGTKVGVPDSAYHALVLQP